MGNNVKVLIGELNGQELDQQEEYVMQLDDMPTVDTSTVPPVAGDVLTYNGTHWVPLESSDGGGLEYGYSKQMGYNGTVTVGKWLNFHHKIPSNQTGFSPPKDVKLKALAIIFENVETVTLTVYKNAVALDTLTVTNDNMGSELNLTHDILTTDVLSVKVTSGVCKDPIFHMYFG